MEAIAMPMSWSDIPEQAHAAFKALRSPEGARMVLEDNMFIEERLPGAVLRGLTDEEMEHYRRPFANPGEDRWPTFAWPRSLPIDGESAEVVEVVNENGSWLAQSDVPKLFINAEPGVIARGRVREFIRSWPNHTEVTVKGLKLLQEDSPDEIGEALSDFVRWLRRIAQGQGCKMKCFGTAQFKEDGGFQR
jgi:haloalkane dehalogenase